MPIQCPSCFAEVADDSDFCPKCGKRLKDASRPDSNDYKTSKRKETIRKYFDYVLIALGLPIVIFIFSVKCMPEEEKDFFVSDLLNGDLFSSYYFSKNGMPSTIEKRARKLIQEALETSPESVVISPFTNISKIGPGRWTATVEVMFRSPNGRLVLNEEPLVLQYEVIRTKIRNGEQLEVRPLTTEKAERRRREMESSGNSFR